MSELRLLPAALAVWGCAGLVIAQRSPMWAAVILLATVMCCALRGWQAHGMLIGSLGAAATVTSFLRVRAVDAFNFGTVITGEVASSATITRTEQWLVHVQLPGLPSTTSVLVAHSPPPPGTEFAATVSCTESERVALNTTVLKASELHEVAAPEGMAALAHSLKAQFQLAVQASVGPSSQGLMPGMVLGDTTLQDYAEKQLYVQTGLSHLSAVSGSNVAIVTSAAVLLARSWVLGPRVQIASAAVTLGLFVLVVGLEPSVLRACVMGIVGMLAAVSSSQSEPIHALCLAVIALVLWDSSLAVSYGFALSVAATAGIVALFPLLYRGLVSPWLPDALARLLAVSIAAEVVTAPIVALMAGEVPVVSVAANVLVAPVVAPVTVLGLCAALLSPFPGRLEWPLLKLAEPGTWWINHVARVCDSVSWGSVETGLVGAGLASAWTVWLIHTKRLPWAIVGLVFTSITWALSYGTLNG
ncbi:ComEC/Rec2 family competence protein [Staphylococcus chromogenes]|nr:ComEC/Rec2 family competence protein [Staphylococcus chromogenes]